MRNHKAIDELRDLLQRAHFLARAIEAEMPERQFLHTIQVSERIHKVRQAAERLDTLLSQGPSAPASPRAQSVPCCRA